MQFEINGHDKILDALWHLSAIALWATAEATGRLHFAVSAK